MVNIAARIRAHGEYTGRTGKRGQRVMRVRCQGCGRYICSDSDLADVDYVKTKRGTELLFHRECAGHVWERKIV